MFIDHAVIHVAAGSGGNGCESRYRDKYNRGGFPDGGDGGRGADIIIRADRNLFTLLDFKYRRHFDGARGGNGSGKKKRGKDAAVLIIRVPPGTVIRDAVEQFVLRDLSSDKDEVCVAHGGKGGSGNHHHGPATPGEPGQKRQLQLDLKLIAEAGVVGFPNAGKSTLIAAISSAHPVIAGYPFTTKEPVLGVVRTDRRSFTVADIPGLIEGSSAGRGLGDRFLRHVERTGALIHVLDMSGSEGRDPLSDYKIINHELRTYDASLARKPQIVVANKMDLDGSAENLARFKKKIRKKIYPISALRKEGLKELIEGIERYV